MKRKKGEGGEGEEFIRGSGDYIAVAFPLRRKGGNALRKIGVAGKKGKKIAAAGREKERISPVISVWGRGKKGGFLSGSLI